jgi:GNAT superfamily N-acetyltransferase
MWLDLIRVQCRLNGKEIGWAEGYWIDRDFIKDDYQWQMRYHTSQTAGLATDLFDDDGDLKTSHRNGGSRIWDTELNKGGMLWIQKVFVLEEWRRKGLGKAIVNAFVQKGCDWAQRSQGVQDVEFVFVRPAQFVTWEKKEEQRAMPQQERIAVIAANKRQAIAFWRSLGFRRIGASAWFGFALESSHKAHKVAFEDDYNPPEEEDDLTWEDSNGVSH